MNRYNYNLKDLFSLIIGIFGICTIMFLDSLNYGSLKYPFLYGFFVGVFSILFTLVFVEYLIKRGII